MLYALYVGFVSLFIALAAIGHVLLLMGLYPNIFGTPQREVSAAEAELAPPAAGKLAA